MTPFQILALPTLAGLFLLEVIGFWRDPVGRGVRWLRGTVWLTAALLIAWPDAVTWVANALGIGRGADLVFYLFVLAFLGGAFYFYSRVVRLQRQITQLVRHLALQDARPGAGLEEEGRS
jgi:hypothetical protein